MQNFEAFLKTLCMMQSIVYLPTYLSPQIGPFELSLTIKDMAWLKFELGR